MTKDRQKKIIKGFAFAIIIIVVLVLIAGALIKQVITKKFTDTIEAFKPVAGITYKALHVNLLSRSFSIDSLIVTYHPQPRFKDREHFIAVPSVKLSGISYFTLLRKKDLQANALDITKPAVVLDTRLFNVTDSLLPHIVDSLEMPFKNITFHNIKINQVTVKQKRGGAENKLLNGDINLGQVDIPYNGSSFTTDSITVGTIECRLHDISYNLPGYHKAAVKSLSVNSSDSTIQIDSITIIPLLGKFELGKKTGYQADHIRAEISQVSIKGADIMQLKKQKFVAASLLIGKSNTHVFRDRRLQRKQEKQPMSIDYLQQIPLAVYIQDFKLTGATVTSEEFPKEGDKPGYIKITGIDINMQPFYNKPYKDHEALTAKVRGNIMSAGIIEATINLSLLTGVEKVKGAIHNLKLPALNPSAENLGQFHIESGILDFLSFSFTATREKATGEIVGEYHDLVVEKLKYTKDGLKKAKLPSLALRAIVIPKNKDASLPVRRRNGTIDFDRDPTRFITFFYIKTLLDGIRNSFALGFVLPK